MVKQYGTTELEKQLNEQHQCREIVKEIMNFGVSQKQILKIIYLLSLELEKPEQIEKFSEIYKEFEEDKTGLI